MLRVAVTLSLFAVVAYFAAAAAHAQVAFDRTVVISAEGGGEVQIDASSEPGVVDIAWKTAGLQYTQWRADSQENDGKVIDGERVAGTTHLIMGISRDDGVVRIGANNSKRLFEWTRGDEGGWSHTDSGARMGVYYGAAGGYDANPETGLGGFTGINAEGQRYVTLEQPGGTWETHVLIEGENVLGRGDFVFDSEGNPVVAYQALKITPQQTYAGRLGSLGTTATGAYRYFPLAITADHDGGLHLLIARHTGQTVYTSSDDGGENWSTPVILAKEGIYGDPAHVAVAASNDGQQIACLFAIRPGLQLAYSSDGGESFSVQPLPGARVQLPGVAFDAEGTLYVVYKDEQALKLHVATPMAQ